MNQLAQRERAAVRAISERRLGLNFAARASPPILPPFLLAEGRSSLISPVAILATSTAHSIAPPGLRWPCGPRDINAPLWCAFLISWSDLCQSVNFKLTHYRISDCRCGFGAQSVVLIPQSTISNQQFINQSLRVPSWFFVPLRGYLFSLACWSEAKPR